MNPNDVSTAEILRADAFEIFGISALQPLQSIVSDEGRLNSAAMHTIDRLSRKLSLRFHPDKNPAGREAFEKVRLCVELLKDPAQLLKLTQQKLGVTRGATARAEQLSRAQAQGAKLEKQMAAEAELRAQEQQRQAMELYSNLERMRSDKAPQAAHAVFERERKAQLNEWEVLEEEMLQDWDVDAETLKRKERDISNAMKWLEQRAASVMQKDAPLRRQRVEP